MKEEVIYAVEKVQNAFDRLQEAVNRAEDDLDRDGVIQRFEFTFELFWKTLRIFLEYEGFQCSSPRSCIKEAAKRGYLEDAELVLDMLEDRNRSSHIYNESTAQELFERIRENYVTIFKKNLSMIRQYLD